MLEYTTLQPDGEASSHTAIGNRPMSGSVFVRCHDTAEKQLSREGGRIRMDQYAESRRFDASILLLYISLTYYPRSTSWVLLRARCGQRGSSTWASQRAGFGLQSMLPPVDFDASLNEP